MYSGGALYLTQPENQATLIAAPTVRVAAAVAAAAAAVLVVAAAVAAGLVF